MRVFNNIENPTAPDRIAHDEPSPDQKARDVLNESRILVLGIQVLLSFQYSGVFEPAFNTLPPLSQLLALAALALLMIAFGLFVAPAPNHLLLWADADGSDLQRFATTVVAIALMPFGAALAIDMYIAIARAAGLVAGAVLGAATFTSAMLFWYGLETLHVRSSAHRNRSRRRKLMMIDAKQQRHPTTEQKIEHALTDARVILPGAQALLGFQLVGVFLSGFASLPASSQYMHVASLTLVTLSIILLMMPAAYHRLVEKGEPSEHFYQLTKNAILCSMIPLGAGICGDFFIVSRKVAGSLALALSITMLLIAVFVTLWFGAPIVRIIARDHSRGVKR